MTNPEDTVVASTDDGPVAIHQPAGRAQSGVAVSATSAGGFKTYQIVYYLFGALEILLAFRVILKLLGANTQTVFVDFIYQLSGVFAAPFAGILRTAQVEGSVFEWSTLVAMAAYAVLAYLIVQLVMVLTTKPVAV